MPGGWQPLPGPPSGQANLPDRPQKSATVVPGFGGGLIFDATGEFLQ
ncbi:hypothetical protein KCP73_04025 [Salmonella enterica subsp. enterica]|nr:hypothetical protein KCP73_04025 [Salmonella enterica subsp. enterica]